MQLPQGITGFRGRNDSVVPATDLAAFKSDCFMIAHALGGSVTKLAVDGVIANYGCIVLMIQDRDVMVLINVHVPVIAFAEPLARTDHQIIFLDELELANRFRSIGTYTVLDRDELESTVTAEACRMLTGAEQDQIKYWKPARLADLVFNNWD